MINMTGWSIALQATLHQRKRRHGSETVLLALLWHGPNTVSPVLQTHFNDRKLVMECQNTCTLGWLENLNCPLV